jgi:hypothetical protein
MSLSIQQSQNAFDLSMMKDKSLFLKTALFSKQIEAGMVPLGSVATDDSSASTIGSNATELQPKRRSMFNRYWTKSGQYPSLATKQINPPLSFGEKSSSDDGLEHSASEISEDNGRPLSPLADEALPRRSVFSINTISTTRFYSFGCLQEISSPQTPVRPQSCIELAKSPASCLRAPRFSGSMRRSSSVSSESSVQFDMESTEIVSFTRPQEVYAEKNWEKYFF